MDDFSKFVKDVRLTYDKESLIRKVADAVSTADILQKIIYLNSERSRLQSECNLLIQINHLNPAIDISGDLRLRQELLNQIGCLLDQMPPWEIKSVLDLHFLHYLHFNQSVSDSFCRHLLHLRGADIRIVSRRGSRCRILCDIP